MLAPRAGGAEGVDLQIAGVDVEVHLLRLRQDRHGGGAGLDASGGLGDRHPLDPMGSALVFKAGPGPLPLHDELDGLDASQLRLAAAGHLQGPAPALRIHNVHPEEVRGEQHGLLAADAAPDLHDHVLAVIGVPGQEEELQLLPQALHVRLGPLDLLLGHLLHFRVAQQLLGGGQVRFRLTVGPVGLHHRLQLLLLPGQAAQKVRVGVGGRVLHLGDHGLQTVGDRLQLIQHGRTSPFLRPGRWSGTRPARRRPPPHSAG